MVRPRCCRSPFKYLRGLALLDAQLTAKDAQDYAEDKDTDSFRYWIPVGL
jgi:hypothetical protein